VPSIKRIISALLLRFGYSINSKSKATLLADLVTANRAIPPNKAKRILASSKSQLGQDILALIFSSVNEPGYFVEFGAGDGIGLSNSYLLEKEFGWSGIMSEPARSWHQKLKQNRSCAIDLRCVYSVSGEKVSFSENYISELSGITSFGENKSDNLLARQTASYEVETISLLDLLVEHKAPGHIDLLSIDTEGSEYEILKDFDFSKFTLGVICVEHNFSQNREKVAALLMANGYKSVYLELSDFDDWFAPISS
jgi:FkbM family methyltransferase